MKVRETIDVAARPQDVWAHLVDPQCLADWHAKLLEVRRSAIGPVYVGERFGTTSIMSKKKGRRQDAETEVLRCEPWTTLAFRHRCREMSEQQWVDETYQLWPQADGRQTRVDHTVDFGHAGMPLWVRGLMWFITRFGEPRGEGILDPLKRACEGSRLAAYA